MVRNQVVGLLKNVFTHVFRNSWTTAWKLAKRVKPLARHGWPYPPEAESGRGRLVFRLGDDGRGLAVGKIRQRPSTTD